MASAPEDYLPVRWPNTEWNSPAGGRPYRWGNLGGEATLGKDFAAHPKTKEEAMEVGLEFHVSKLALFDGLLIALMTSDARPKVWNKEPVNVSIWRRRSMEP